MMTHTPPGSDPHSPRTSDRPDGLDGPDRPPARFNMAAWCLAPAPHRPANKTALIIEHGAGPGGPEAGRWTYGALDRAVRALAGALRTFGLAPGDRVLIRMGNTPDAALMFFGAIAGGFVPVPVSAQLTAAEVRFVLEDSGARLVAVSPDLETDLPAGVRVLEPADIARLRAHDPAPYAETRAEDPAFLVYTSGTSGRPKGVLHAHRSVWGRRPMIAGWAGLGPDDVLVHAGAMNWTYTLGVGLSDPWSVGATSVLYNGPRDMSVWPRLIAHHRATLFAAVPGVYRQMLRTDSATPEAFASLRHGLTAGEALAGDVAAAWQARAGRPLYEALGMSECSTYISSGPATPVRPGSPGRPQPGRRVAILDLDDAAGIRLLPPGETGLLAVHRSDPGLMLGYWNRPEEDAQVWRGDWFCGGDLARFDDDGYVWFEGRADDVMNALGYRVSPAEVEAALSAHPAVAEAAAREVGTASGARIIAAFVRLEPGLPAPSADALKAHARARLAAYKCPREIRFVDDLPRTANGKLARRLLPDHL